MRVSFSSLAIILSYLFSSRAGLGGCTKREHLLVGDVTTLRRHMASVHKVCVLLRMFDYMLTNYVDILEYLPKMGEDCKLRLNASR